MTKIVQIVIMQQFNYETLRQLLEETVPSAPREDPKERKRLKIIQAATELFIKQGYRKTSVDQVARHAGVAKGTVYLYVKNKGELLLQAIIEEKKHYVGLLRDILSPDRAPQDQLRLWIKTALILAAQMPLTSKLISGDREVLAAIEEMPTEVIEKSELFRLHFTSELLERAAYPHRFTPSELHDRAKVLYGLFFFAPVILDERIRSGLSLERFTEILTDMILYGVSPRRRIGSSRDSQSPSQMDETTTRPLKGDRK